MLSKAVALLALVALVGAVHEDDVSRLYSHALSFAQDSHHYSSGLRANVNAQFFLHGWDELELRQCSECPAGKAVQRPCSVSRDTVCHDGPAAKIISTPAGFMPYEEDGAGQKWVRVIQMKEDIAVSRDEVGDIKVSLSDGGDSAKVSDDTINFFTHKSGRRVYRIKSLKKAAKYAYISVAEEHDDTKASWGMVTRSSFIKLADDKLDCSNTNGWGKFTHAWVDLLYSTPRQATEDCDRYFMGHGRFDCYRKPNMNVRCICGGSRCNPRSYPMLDDVEVHVLVEE
jgi:hypothetical protein